MKVLGTRFQVSKKTQSSCARGIPPGFWRDLNFGISSFFGTWNLELGTCTFALLLALTFLPACSAPIRADKTSVARVYREMRRSALDGGQYSNLTRAVLARYDWERSFHKEPTQVLRRLHDKVLVDERADLLFALAELNYFHAERLRRSVKAGEPRKAPDFFLSSAVYAWLYMVRQAETEPNPFEQRLQLARDIYNRGLGQGLLLPGATNGAVSLQPGRRHLLPGAAEVRLDTAKFSFPIESFAEFVMADAYSVIGLDVRNRQSGLGAPLIASSTPSSVKGYFPRMPVTALLRVEGGAKEWSAGQLKLSLELYSGYDTHTARLGAREVPLAVDSTAPVAYALNNSSVWRLGLQQFLSSREIVKSGVYPMQPYRPGAIPVVLVHGTLSSPVYWAEMWKTLRSDTALREHYQFWVYIYNSGNPLTWSAANLRDALSQTVADLDPQAKDSALRKMVLIGHSQGGLLAKLAVTPTEDRIWRLFSDKNLEELDIPQSLRAEIRRNVFIEPLPFVKRVIFMATPHRGSFLSTSFVRRFAARLISLPSQLVETVGQIAQLQEKVKLPPQLKGRIPTSLDGMSPDNPLLLALAEIPPAPGVKCHSIIAVKGEDSPDQGNDGVVAYQSAHVSYSDSELVVRCSHSCQDHPAAIEEVRRILLEHLPQTASK